MHSSVFPPRWCFFSSFYEANKSTYWVLFELLLSWTRRIDLTWSFCQNRSEAGIILNADKACACDFGKRNFRSPFGLRMWRDFFRFFAAKHGTLALGSLLTGGTGSTCSLQRWGSLFYHVLSCFIMFSYLAHWTIIAQATKSSSCTALLEEE